LSVVWAPSGEVSLQKILIFYKDKGAVEFISKVLDKIDDLVELIMKWPDIGPVFHVLDDRIYRKVKVSKNIVMVYRNDGNVVRILKFLDLRNQPETDLFVEGL
jgi:plasmid stabilization system protein ParE